MIRRQFIRLSKALLYTSLIPKSAYTFSKLKSVSDSPKNLVIIHLKGGNDVLNTIIPINNDFYYQARPTLAIKRNSSLKIDNNYAFHLALPFLSSLNNKGVVSILLGTGHDYSSGSHFTASDVLFTGSSDSRNRLGYVGRHLDSENNLNAFLMKGQHTLLYKGNHSHGLSMENGALNMRFTNNSSFFTTWKESKNDNIRSVINETNVLNNILLETQNVKLAGKSFSSNSFETQLKNTAKIISTSKRPNLFLLEHNGFDNHSNQASQHHKALKILDVGLKNFMSYIESMDKNKETTILILSEFGRRIQENANGGTDHGEGGLTLIISEQLKKPGMYRSMPDIDFRKNINIPTIINQADIWEEVLTSFIGTKVYRSSASNLNLF